MKGKKKVFPKVQKLLTAARARGLSVVYSLSQEQYVAWHLVNAPRVATQVTLSKIELIKF